MRENIIRAYCTLLFCRITLGLLLFSNQQVSRAVAESPMVTETVIEDLKAFVSKTQEQAAGITSEATDFTVKLLRQDLNSR